MKVIYNSKLARLLIPNFKAILIMCWLLCKKGPEYYSAAFLKHEETHEFQWKSCCFLGIFACLALSLCFNSLWPLLFIPLTFYVWYGIEYVIRLVIETVCAPADLFEGFGELSHKAYRKIVFEQEARAVEQGIVTYEFLSFSSTTNHLVLI